MTEQKPSTNVGGDAGGRKSPFIVVGSKNRYTHYGNWYEEFPKVLNKSTLWKNIL